MQHHIFVLAFRLFPLFVVSSVGIQLLAPVSSQWPLCRLLSAFDVLLFMLVAISSPGLVLSRWIHRRHVKSNASRSGRGGCSNLPFLHPIFCHSDHLISLNSLSSLLTPQFTNLYIPSPAQTTLVATIATLRGKILNRDPDFRMTDSCSRSCFMPE